MMAFKRVLIANRGEIALRILRALRDMGISAAIIHGREDRLSLPVRLSDVAVPIRRDNPLDSYLDIEAVIQAAKDIGADAIHPGYGFLAENANFVRRLEEEGITFIGPSSEVMTLLGDKIEARKAMEAAGLPIAQGSSEPIDEAGVASALADKRLPCNHQGGCRRRWNRHADSQRRRRIRRCAQTLSESSAVGLWRCASIR